jgi:hypothetical protein
MRTETRMVMAVTAVVLASAQVAYAVPPRRAEIASAAAPIAVASGNVGTNPNPKPTPNATPTPNPTPSPNAAPTPSAAAPRKTPTPKPTRAQVQREAEQKLNSADPNAIRQALESLGTLGGDAAAAAVSARLRRGLWPELTEQAISTLVQIGKPNAGPVLLELSLHRRPLVRAKALAALGALKIRSGQSSLLYALDDPSPEVRAAAVSALGVVGTARALPALFAAADHGEQYAFEAIGNIASAKELKPILDRATGIDLKLIAPALRALLARANLPQPAKQTVIDHLIDLGTPAARALLVEALAARKPAPDKKDTNPRLTALLADAVARFDRGQKQVASANDKPAAQPVAAQPVAAQPVAAQPVATQPVAVTTGAKP